MFEFERRVCNAVRRIVAVSGEDAEMMRNMFSVRDVVQVPTGVDLEYFARPANVPKASDLVFLGSMDWAPNIDGMRFFTERILPRVRRRLPHCSVAIVGRRPVPDIIEMGERDPAVTVSGTVDDVRPYLWGSAVSIVPLRIGGGTRLKIFESMAAHVPVVSTTIGAEGLEVTSPENIRLADDPDEFAEHCIELLTSEAERNRISAAGWELVNSRFSWERVTDQFERALC